jgi:hypothetical protein
VTQLHPQFVCAVENASVGIVPAPAKLGVVDALRLSHSLNLVTNPFLLIGHFSFSSASKNRLTE